MDSKIVKRIKSLSWSTVMMSLPFISGFLLSSDVRNLVEKYPEQLGIIVSVGLILAQVSKYWNNYIQFKKELKDLESNS